jgi:hypothetical protein
MTKKKSSEKKEVFDFKSIQKPEDAFKRLGMDPSVMPDLSKLPERFGFLAVVFILAVICEAVNDKWKADYSNHNQKKYFPWGSVSSVGLAFSDSDCDCAYAIANVGFPLVFESPEKAKYVFEKFPDLWKVWLLNVKSE